MELVPPSMVGYMLHPQCAVRPSTSVKLLMKANNLKDLDVFSKSDPMCVVFQKRRLISGKDEWKEIGRTETIWNNLNPEWAQEVLMEYFFEERQQLMFKLFDVDNVHGSLDTQDFLGQIECELAEIVSSGSITRRLVGLRGNCGTLTISCEELDEGARELLVFIATGTKLDRKDFFGKSDPYLNFYRVNNDLTTKQLVHRTEHIYRTLNPCWKKFEITKKSLCQGDEDRAIVISCFDHNEQMEHKLIGSVTTNIKELLANDRSFPLVNEKKRIKKGAKYKNSGVLTIHTTLTKQYTFLDYIAGGTQLDFAVAIDFTASNGAATQPSSLHYINSGRPNQYEVAIKSVLEICQFYNNSKTFDAFGFGAIVPPNPKVNKIFQLRNPGVNVFDPSVVGVNGVMSAYKDCIHRVQLYGPTDFAPIVREITKKASNAAYSNGARYQILLIITDGEISDMAQTKRAIVNASNLPLSIIIVGVGNAEFDAMEELDGDDQRLSADGFFAARDIVQFVPMRQFLRGNNLTQLEYERVQATLAKEVLYEVPAQLTSYMKSRGIVPRPPNDPFPRDPCAEQSTDSFDSPGPLPQKNGMPPMHPQATCPSQHINEYNGYGNAGPSSSAAPPYPGVGSSPHIQRSMAPDMPYPVVEPPPAYAFQNDLNEQMSNFQIGSH